LKKSINIWSFVGKTNREAIKLAKDAGFEGIELAMDAAGEISAEATPEQLADLKAYADDLGMAIPSLSNGLCWGASLTSDDPAERQEAHDLIVQQLRCARALGAETVLVVPGSVSVEFVPERPVIPYDVAYDRALEEIRKLVPAAEKYGVEIGIENVWNKMLLSPLEMRQFIDAVGSDMVGAYFDTGNVVYSGYPEHWIRILGKRIKKVHFKDYRRNPGTLNAFVDLLSGDVNWPEVMKAFHDIGYEGWAAGEMIPQYAYASDQIIYNTSASMERILNERF
jgi:hexulose-6-phosphate isomerase